ncbi:MAG: Uncharacterized protein XU08_C0001G0274 [candidate division WWE3 bacterium CSP1-7]|jgi:hypothetical protein|uniref:TrbL/VirB6 plasmid conjugal transfer protein n=1 Tax=candidate division WWE3 bacterium CSP1-7 TaxID=1576480 RepID=A0A0T5ZYR8_UNCKA|nr:MAG: Uncharacterized protein XU08_C0001G0274 [candidate division WWE3 bacterium CSP1-7]
MGKLKLLVLPLLVFVLLAVKPTPVQAASLIDVWGDLKCVADINCTVEAAGAAGINFLFRSAVGKDADKLTANDVSQMARGEWDKGMVSAVGEIGSLAYKIPPTGNHFANIIKNTLSNNILNSRANAQEGGIGTEILSPIETFWKSTRNVAYGLFVIVMIAIGFMIILQRQLPTRTVVTFTYALPRILAGLVLITFSLPIIALIFDIFAVFASYLVSSIAVQTVIQNITSAIEVSGGAAELVGGLPTLLAGQIIGRVVNLGASGLVQLILMTILILGGIVLFVLTTIRLLSAYVFILLNTIFSPLVILFGSLPGQEGTITDLGKKLIAKTLVFPLILFFFILALFFAAQTVFPATTFLSGGNFKEVVGETILFSTSLLGPILTLSMLVAAYKAPGLLEEGLGLNKPRGKK